MSDGESTVIVRTVARVVFPLVLLTAIALLLRGHNLPGGGFIAGVLTTAAFALVYIAYGLDYPDSGLFGRAPDGVSPFDSGPGLVDGYRYLSAVGLALAAGSGVVAVLLGVPFLAQAVVFVEHLPLYGEIEVASALAFDVGVYLVVVGALLTIVAVVGAE
ncbi:sodium:proton antiporter [Halobacteriales archaeon QS_4_69_34]|nr:MAG: sodium:proton antiporter [Halobacteriales archaeon QS_4_69_34]